MVAKQSHKGTMVFTGGGSAGHVVPCLPIIDKLKNHYNITYIGSRKGIERSIVNKQGLAYTAISTGKLRRYFSWLNLLDLFKVCWGFLQACYILYKLQPVMLFSKGGFVALPVVYAAKILRVQVISHESDLVHGLTTKLTAPFSTVICLAFANDHYSSHHKYIVTGMPIRPLIANGNKHNGNKICGFTANRKTIMFLGGGNGSRLMNNLAKQHLPWLLKFYNVIHITGIQTKLETINSEHYAAFDFVDDAIGDLLAIADLVITRAGATIMHELLFLAKSAIFVPLSTKVSRGEQITNAEYAKANFGSTVILEEELWQFDHQMVEKSLGSDMQLIKKALVNHSATDLVLEQIFKLIK